MKKKIIITDHAFERAEERLNIGKKSLERFAEKAYVEGVKHSDTKGKLNKYITKIWAVDKEVNNVRIYGENVFLFVDNRLITLYHLPNEFKKYIKVFSNMVKKDLVKKETVKKQDYYECSRCDKNSVKDHVFGSCPCPRGSCEAEIVGKVIVTTQIVMNPKKPVEKFTKEQLESNVMELSDMLPFETAPDLVLLKKSKHEKKSKPRNRGKSNRK